MLSPRTLAVKWAMGLKQSSFFIGNSLLSLQVKLLDIDPHPLLKILFSQKASSPYQSHLNWGQNRYKFETLISKPRRTMQYFPLFSFRIQITFGNFSKVLKVQLQLHFITCLASNLTNECIDRFKECDFSITICILWMKKWNLFFLCTVISKLG